MGQVVMAKVGKKGAIYLPRRVMEQLGIQEGDRVAIHAEKDRLILEVIPDPFTLAVKTEKWAKTTVEEFEAESEADQDETAG